VLLDAHLIGVVDCDYTTIVIRQVLSGWLVQFMEPSLQIEALPVFLPTCMGILSVDRLCWAIVLIVIVDLFKFATYAGRSKGLGVALSYFWNVK
jgi:hypothetical protein